jgi:hypothetical protein
MLKSEGTGLSKGKHILTTQSGLSIWPREIRIRTNPSFEYYCQVVAILPSRSLRRVSRKVQGWFLGGEGGVTRLSYPTEHCKDELAES